MKEIERVLNPKSIAVVGASDNPDKWGYGIMERITSDGFAGSVYPVNARSREVFGLDAFSSLEDIPDEVDMVNISIPGKFVAEVVKQAVDRGVKSVVINTNGYREVGRGDLETELLEIIKDSDTRIIGPNVQGIMNVQNKLSLNLGTKLFDQGPVGIIAQSGSVSAYIGEKMGDDGIGISTMFNLGNQIDLCESDFIEYLAGDEQTKVIAIYLEGPKDKDLFKETLIRNALKKPIVMFKPGSTEQGTEAAASHTGSIAGNDRIFSAACQQYGVLRCDDLLGYVDSIKAFALCPLPEGSRTVVMSTSGGVGSIVIDEVYKNGLEMARLPAVARQEIETLTGVKVPENGLLDLAIDTGIWQKVIETLCKNYSGCFDSILIVVADGVNNVEAMAGYAKNRTSKPILAVYMSYGDQYRENAISCLKHEGIAYYGSPERAVRSLKNLLWYRDKQVNI